MQSKNRFTGGLCDTIPSPQRSFHLRPREKGKEIQPNLKLRYFGNERLQECLTTQIKFLGTSLDSLSTINYLTKDYSGNEKSRFEGGKHVSGTITVKFILKLLRVWLYICIVLLEIQVE